MRGEQRGRARIAVRLLTLAIAVEFAAATGATGYLVATDHRPQAALSTSMPRPAAVVTKPGASRGTDNSGPGKTDIATIPPDERTLRATAIRALLDRRSRALLARDRTAFLAGIDPGSPAFRVRQAALFDNLRAVPLRRWSYVVDEFHELPQSPSRLGRFQAPLWVPQLQVQYQLAGFDSVPTRQRQYDTFVRRAGKWYLGADDDFADAGGQSGRGLWDFGPVVATRTATSLVLGHPKSRAMLAIVSGVTDAAIPRVTAVWGTDWARKVVVLVPDSQAELGSILQEGNDLSQIAAVATADLSGTGGGPAGERIIVNPPNFAKLGTLGRQVVLQHEITHVASRAVTTAATPTWLAEGFADYVGYLGTGVPVASAAHELAVDLRAGRVPRALPTAAAFDGTNPALAQTYEMSWLACRLIASVTDTPGLVSFYREVAHYQGSPSLAVDAALRDRLKLSTAEFTTRWRSYLTRQLR